ncbi:hypothetical protein [Chitinophaga sp.]|uniref:hypothetical protein n=1 Tax=Chitinophaga sp. TaxID=1869181 RepID=UPI002F953305
MTEQVFTIDTDAKLLDIDTDNNGNYIAITDRHEVITPLFRVQLPMDHRFIMIRQLNSSLFLVVSLETKRTINIRIYNNEGILRQSFFAGNSIEDVLVFEDKIVCTYFDEGVFGDEGPNTEGLAVFNFQGQMLYGFNSNANWLIADCYCACKMNANTVLFYPYADFPMIALNLNTFTWERHETPIEFQGAHVMSYNAGQVILHSTYKNKENFFLWDMKGNDVKKAGAFSGRLKGLENGKFMSFGNNGFSIIDPLNIPG